MFHVRTEPIRVFNREVTAREKAISLGAREYLSVRTLKYVVTLVLFYLAGVTSSIFWLLGATITVTLIHSLFYIPIEENEFDFTSPPGQPQQIV